MSELDDAFGAHAAGLAHAVELLIGAERARSPDTAESTLPPALPELGIGATATIEQLADPVLRQARSLGAPGFFAHMDPPTPWITWAMQLWTASRNQNLLHPDTGPVARELESVVIDWLAPRFGMRGGHMTPGATVANLTALWAAREAGAHTVVATHNAHISIAKAAHLLGMFYRPVRDWSRPFDMAGCAAVITAGTTSTGEIEALDAAHDAHWRHVDAAWAGPLRLSNRHAPLLEGIEVADSVTVSAHKWLFQPKESALVLFGDVDTAHHSISFGADYLAVPNVGVLGSHGAMAVPLLATLLAYGRDGIASWIDRSMGLADTLAQLIELEPNLELRTEPRSGVVNWRHREIDAADVQQQLPDDVFVSATTIDGSQWLRSVAANPMAEPTRVVAAVAALG